MTTKDLFLHLRFPFSFFLMPIFWLAVSQQSHGIWIQNFVIFIVLHIFIYPASNAYNSYFDKDEDSIGGLKNPPKVDRSLWKTANYFDATGLLLSFFFVNSTFGVLILLYVLVSRMYSWTGIRLKKHAILSWFIVGIFQGALVYFMVFTFGQNLSLPTFIDSYNTINQRDILGCLIAALILWAIYPITQVYQHKSDRKNGDNTMSMLLGIKGTFVFCIIFFTASLFVSYVYLPQHLFFRFLIFSGPVSGFMGYWFFKVLKDERFADFKHTMQMNILSPILLNICFFSFCIYK